MKTKLKCAWCKTEFDGQKFPYSPDIRFCSKSHKALYQHAIEIHKPESKIWDTSYYTALGKSMNLTPKQAYEWNQKKYKPKQSLMFNWKLKKTI